MTPISAEAFARLYVPYATTDALTVDELKLRLLDALLAIFGGAMVTSPAELEAVAASTPGKGIARSVVPAGEATSAESAAFVNGFLIRQADWGDSFIQDGVVSGHPSDMLAAIVALCDASDATGSSILELVNLAYRLYAAFRAALPALSPNGWDYTTVHALSVPILAAVRYGDALDRLNNAVRLSSSGGGVSAQLRAGDVTNWKSGATSYALARAIWSYRMSTVMQASASMFNGPRGWNRLVAPLDEATLETIQLDSDDIYGRLNVKKYPCFQVAQTPVAGAIHLHPVLKARLEQVERVHVRVSDKNANIANRPGRPRFPDNHAAADHHLPYCVAAGLTHGMLTPAFYEHAYLESPALRRLIERTVVETFGPDSTRGGESCQLDVHLADGSTLSHAVDLSPGSFSGLSTTDRLARLRDVIGYKREVVESTWSCDLSPLMDTIESLEQRTGRDLISAVHDAIGARTTHAATHMLRR